MKNHCVTHRFTGFPSDCLFLRSCEIYVPGRVEFRTLLRYIRVSLGRIGP